MNNSNTTSKAHVDDSSTVVDDGLFVVPEAFYSDRLQQTRANIEAYTEMMMLAPSGSEEAVLIIFELKRLTHVEDVLCAIIWRA
jgi:hypothetical protein